jgi:hyperosmotically inducible periplasmic protein
LTGFRSSTVPTTSRMLGHRAEFWLSSWTSQGVSQAVHPKFHVPVSMRVLSAILLMFCVSFLLPDAVAQRNTGRYDEQILQDANKLLQSKRVPRGSSPHRGSDRHAGRNGESLYRSRQPGKKVNKIKNVEGVRNHVQVQSNVPDDQLRERLADKLRYDRVGFGIAFNAIALDVKDRVVTLGGTVRDYPSRDSAVAIAETTPGVKDIRDNIEVAPTSTFDDDLRVKLHRAIYGQSSLRRYELDPQKPIRIVVENGKVTLYGVVDNAMDKPIAGLQASGGPGVFSVDNKLVVASQK